MSNDLQTNLRYIIMIDYDSFSHCHLTDIFFAFHAGAKELKEHLLTFWKIHQCDHFTHDGAPAHKSKIVTKFLNSHNIHVLEWPGNSPNLNPIENAWNFLKDKIQTVKHH